MVFGRYGVRISPKHLAILIKKETTSQEYGVRYYESCIFLCSDTDVSERHATSIVGVEDWKCDHRRQEYTVSQPGIVMENESFNVSTAASHFNPEDGSMFLRNVARQQS
jgi:hypothetical protein